MKVLLSCITAFVIAGGGAILAVMGSGYDANRRTWIIGVIIGAMASSKDYRSSMRLPPVNGKSLDTEQFRKPPSTTV
jgi:hypothetical protein